MKIAFVLAALALTAGSALAKKQSESTVSESKLHSVDFESASSTSSSTSDVVAHYVNQLRAADHQICGLGPWGLELISGKSEKKHEYEGESSSSSSSSTSSEVSVQDVAAGVVDYLHKFYVPAKFTVNHEENEELYTCDTRETAIDECVAGSALFDSSDGFFSLNVDGKDYDGKTVHNVELFYMACNEKYYADEPECQRFNTCASISGYQNLDFAQFCDCLTAPPTPAPTPFDCHEVTEACELNAECCEGHSCEPVGGVIATDFSASTSTDEDSSIITSSGSSGTTTQYEARCCANYGVECTENTECCSLACVEGLCAANVPIGAMGCLIVGEDEQKNSDSSTPQEYFDTCEGNSQCETITESTSAATSEGSFDADDVTRCCIPEGVSNPLNDVELCCTKENFAAILTDEGECDYVRMGDACEEDSQCPAGACIASICQFIPQGQFCEENVDCGLFATCATFGDNDVCGCTTDILAFRNKCPGTRCVGSGACASGSCQGSFSNRRCTTLNDGAPCVSNAHCASGLCELNTATNTTSCVAA